MNQPLNQAQEAFQAACERKVQPEHAQQMAVAAFFLTLTEIVVACRPLIQQAINQAELERRKTN